MKSEYLLILNFILASRLIYLFEERVSPARRTVVLTVIPLLAAPLFVLDLPAVLFLGLLAAAGLAIGLFEQKARPESPDRFRFMVLLVYLFSFLLVVPNIVELRFRPGNSAFWQQTFRHLPVVDFVHNIGLGHLSLLTMGLLLAGNETNIFIRLCFGWFKIRLPKNPETKSGSRMFSAEDYGFLAGRVIGILERIITYILIMSGSIEALGFIIAAKTFARYKELEKRESAEYVLIGTLLSILCAVVIGLAIKVFIDHGIGVI